jgi:hypothetical protein
MAPGFRNHFALAWLTAGVALCPVAAAAQHPPKEPHIARFTVCDIASAYKEVGRTVAVKGKAEQSIEWAGLVDERCPLHIVYLRYRDGGPTIMSCLTDNRPRAACGGYRVNM